MNPLPPEDHFADIIAKAQRGLRLRDLDLARRAGVTGPELARVKAGEFNEAIVRKLAGPLQLAADALVENARQAWPRAGAVIAGLKMFTTSFSGMLVNAYLAWDETGRQAVAFDTGANVSPLLDFLNTHGLTLSLVLLTHGHADHVGDLARLVSTTAAAAWSSDQEAAPHTQRFSWGHSFTVGRLRIETRQTSGHTRGGTTYVIAGLEKPVAVVGDALFAGSMGGGMYSYEEALRTNRASIFTLLDETILCCGHGPLTTVGEEKLHNPFFAETARDITSSPTPAS